MNSDFPERLMRSSLALCLCSGMLACGGGSDADQSSAAAPMSLPVETLSTVTAPSMVSDLPSPVTTFVLSLTAEPVSMTTTVTGSCGLNGAAGPRAELLERINALRAAGAVCGSVLYSPAPSLNWNDRLVAAAVSHASEMAKNDFFSHTGLDGSSFDQRIASTGYRLTAGAENIAGGQTSVQTVIASWINSPGHCRNLMNPNYRDVGVACELSDAAYSHYWVMSLGRE